MGQSKSKLLENPHKCDEKTEFTPPTNEKVENIDKEIVKNSHIDILRKSEQLYNNDELAKYIANLIMKNITDKCNSVSMTTYGDFILYKGEGRYETACKKTWRGLREPYVQSQVREIFAKDGIVFRCKYDLVDSTWQWLLEYKKL